MMEETVQSMFSRGLIDKHTKAFLIPHQPRTARLCLLPKIHKPNHHWRPIVSSSGAATENISWYVDHFLKPLVSSIPVYIRDTTDFLNKLGQLPPLPPGCLLYSHLGSLLAVCQHSQCWEDCSMWGSPQPKRSAAAPNSWPLPLIRLILTRNVLTFKGDIFLQQHGTAMGTRMVPSYANLFMGKLEREFFQTHDQQPLVWWGTLMTSLPSGPTVHHSWRSSYWTWTVNMLPSSSLHPGLHAEEIIFLDTRVYLNNQHIETYRSACEADGYPQVSPCQTLPPLTL